MRAPRFGDGYDIVENRLERLGRHQIGNESGDAALGRGRGFAVGIERLARARDVLAVPEMQVHVDRARHDRRGRAPATLPRRGEPPRPAPEWPAILPSRMAMSQDGPSAAGKNGVAAADHQIEGCSSDAGIRRLLRTSISTPSAVERVAGRHHVGVFRRHVEQVDRVRGRGLRS